MSLEYRIEYLRGDARDIEALEKLSEEGWELVTAFPNELKRGQMIVHTVVAYLKRKREE
ncbi:MAG: hypothetical protein IT210_01950 [Armatimonadetes bacterium]|nr:hypothetical protein [Armatimonadota bacterium]